MFDKSILLVIGYFIIGFFVICKFLDYKYDYNKTLNYNIEQETFNIYLAFLIFVWPLLTIYLFYRLCIKKLKLINLKQLRLKK
jgi:hypothetical protein